MRFILILVFLVPLAVHGQLRGKVVRVADGDTFTVLAGQRQVRVRLFGIDSPEKGQDHYQVARDYLSRLVMHREVVIETRNRDRYGRVIGVAFVGGINVNEKLLAEGMVWHFTRYDRSTEWSALEARARLAKKGLWSNPRAVAPWEFRREVR